MADALAAVKSAVGFVGLGAKVSAPTVSLLAGAEAGAQVGQVTGPVGAATGLVTGGLGLATAQTTEGRIAGGLQVIQGALAAATAVAAQMGAAIASTLATITGVVAAPVAVAGFALSNSVAQQAEKVKNAVHEWNTISRDLPKSIPQVLLPLKFLPLVRYIPRLRSQAEQEAILKQYNLAAAVAQAAGSTLSGQMAIVHSGNAVGGGRATPELDAAMTEAQLQTMLLRLVTQDVLARRGRTFNSAWPTGVVGRAQVIPWLWDHAVPGAARRGTYPGYSEPVSTISEQTDWTLEGPIIPLRPDLAHLYALTDQPGVSLAAAIQYFHVVDPARFAASRMYRALRDHRIVDTLAALTPREWKPNLARWMRVVNAGISEPGGGSADPDRVFTESEIQAAITADRTLVSTAGRIWDQAQNAWIIPGAPTKPIL